MLFCFCLKFSVAWFHTDFVLFLKRGEGGREVSGGSGGVFEFSCFLFVVFAVAGVSSCVACGCVLPFVCRLCFTGTSGR